MNETDSSLFQKVDNFLDKYPVSGIFSIVVGCIWLLLRFYFFVTGIYRGFKQFLWPSCRALDFISLYGEYVIITAASNGIGFQLGKQFLKRGHSVVLIDYDVEQLTKAKDDLQKYVQNGRDLMIVAIETNYDEAYQSIQRQFENIKSKIGILINNANVTLSKEEYLNYSNEQISDTIRSNIISVLMITKKILLFMVQNRKGHILNITSPSGCQPISSSGFFDATKYFVDFFGKTLIAEYSNKNITVQTLNPGFIVTEGDAVSKCCFCLRCLMPTSQKFVRSAISTIGRGEQTSGHWMHALIAVFWRLTPDWLFKLYNWVCGKLTCRKCACFEKLNCCKCACCK